MANNAGFAGTRLRRTLAHSTETLSGVGLHSGAPATVRVHPAGPGAGITFVDYDTRQEIAARAENVCDTTRCTILGAAGVTVQTVEHLLSALAGLGIDDARIESQGGELPAADGSAAPFAALIAAAGTREHGTAVEVLRLARPILVQGEGGASVAALPADAWSATVILDYPKHPWIGTQAVTFDSCGNYTLDIAPARTFGFLTEIAWLRAHGLALGASYENGIALRDDGYDVSLRFEDELARHKMLDLIGDLALVGRPVQAHFIAIKPSHTLNTSLARRLADEFAA